MPDDDPLSGIGFANTSTIRSVNFHYGFRKSFDDSNVQVWMTRY